MIRDHEDYDLESDDDAEPIGSCENCGLDLYADDDDDLCAECDWLREQK